MLRRAFTIFVFLLTLAACSTAKPELDDVKVVRLDGFTSFVTLKNIGETGSVLEWQAYSNSKRLTVNPSSGSLYVKPESTDSKTVRISIDPSQLELDELFNATVFIRTNAGDRQVVASFKRDIPGLGECFPEGTSRLVTQTHSADPNAEYVPGQLLVRYNDALSLSSLEKREGYLETAASVLDSYSLSLLSSGLGLEPDLLEVDVDDLEAFAKELEKDPRIAYAEPNYYLYLHARPNDPLLNEQWHLLDFGLPQAWDIKLPQPPRDVTIAVIDSAFDLRHEDLGERFVPGCDFYGVDGDVGDNDPSHDRSNDAVEHGTHVAGVIAATGNNGIGVAGLAYGQGIRAVPVKVFDATGGATSEAVVAKALRWAAGLPVAGANTNRYPANIINLSVGTRTKQRIQVLDEAIADVSEAGVLVIVSAGNVGGVSDWIAAPANAPDAVAVGSVDSDFIRSSFSQYDNTGGKTVTLMAPGGSFVGETEGCGEIFSTLLNNTYGCKSGTSFSAPFVAGVAALIWQQNPNFTAQQVLARLKASTRFDSDWDAKEYGAGVVCADKALGASTTCGR